MVERRLPFVYIAGPYSSPDPVLGTRNAVAMADRLLGYVIPIIPHLSMLWHTISPKPYEEWLIYDLALLETCDALIRLPGWSSGADREVAHAYKIGIPVFEIEHDDRLVRFNRWLETWMYSPEDHASDSDPSPVDPPE